MIVESENKKKMRPKTKMNIMEIRKAVMNHQGDVNIISTISTSTPSSDVDNDDSPQPGTRMRIPSTHPHN